MSKKKVTLYVDVEEWERLKTIAPDRQVSKFVRFVLSDAMCKIQLGQYQSELNQYMDSNFGNIHRGK